MQLQGLFLMLIMLIIFPIIIFSADYNFFIVIMSLILFFSSLKHMFSRILLPDDNQLNDDSFLEDIESLTNIDIKKFDTGINVIKNLTIILFFLCIVFYHMNFIFMILITFVLTYWIYNTLIIINPFNKGDLLSLNSSLNSILFFITNIASIAIILFFIYEIFMKNYFEL